MKSSVSRRKFEFVARVRNSRPVFGVISCASGRGASLAKLVSSRGNAGQLVGLCFLADVPRSSVSSTRRASAWQGWSALVTMLVEWSPL